MLRHPEVVRLRVIQRRHHVPRRPTGGEVVQRRKQPGHMERRVVRRRVRRPQSKMRRRQPHRRYHWHQVQLHHPHTMLHRLGVGVPVPAGHRQPVVYERHVKPRRLQRPCNILVVAQVKKIRRRLRVSPRPGIVGAVGRLHKGDKQHFPLGRSRHVNSLCGAEFPLVGVGYSMTSAMLPEVPLAGRVWRHDG